MLQDDYDDKVSDDSNGEGKGRPCLRASVTYWSLQNVLVKELTRWLRTRAYRASCLSVWNSPVKLRMHPNTNWSSSKHFRHT